MIPGGLLSSGNPNFKDLWNQIRLIGASFKGVRYPSHDEHQNAWEHFQRLINDVKALQEKEQEKWDRNKHESSMYRDRIIAQADRARLSTAMDDLIINLVTMGLKGALDSLMGPFDERKHELLSAGEELKTGWNMLSEYKENMLGVDKQTAFTALNKAKAILDTEWGIYKRERQKAFEKHQQQFENKQQAWQDRVKENIRNLEERRDRLNAVLSHKESHLDDLHSKLDDAWSDDYKSRISGWIDEEKSNIDDIRNKLSKVEDWLYEAQSKLN